MFFMCYSQMYTLIYNQIDCFAIFIKTYIKAAILVYRF